MVMAVNFTDQPPSIVYRNRNMEASVYHRIAGGEVALFSSRCPGKASANEDTAAIVPINDDSCVLIVADGMGGHCAGEVASRTAVREMILAVNECRANNSIPRVGIINGFERANQAVKDLGTGSGTTLAVVEITAQEARPYHAGDSVILIVGSRGKVKLETVSHSPVGFGVAAGLLDSDEAMQHEDRHLVLNAIGSSSMRIEIGSAIKLSSRDTVLLASDGLTDNVSLDETVEMVRKGDLLGSSNTLSRYARRQMEGNGERRCKPDDLTVLLFRGGSR